MNSIAKQCMINQLGLPYEIRDMIKSYCFYDIKTWEIIQFIHYKKRTINHIFKHHVTSTRARPSEYYENDDDDGHWAFWTDTDEDRDTHQFQSSNCIVCGNYDATYAPNYISRNIICNCPRVHYIDYDLDYFDEVMDDFGYFTDETGSNNSDW
jgi:hypothetical protein